MAYNNNPYNFVPLWEQVYQRYNTIDDLPRHNQWYPNLFTGVISCTFTAETPVCVSNGERQGGNDFFRDADNQYVLPGSTLKGMVRTNMMILGRGALRPGEDLDDTRMLYRVMADAASSVRAKVKKEYLKSLLTDENEVNVSGCYLKREGQSYYIYQSRYYPVKRYVLTKEEREDYHQQCENLKEKMNLNQKMVRFADAEEREKRKQQEQIYKSKCKDLKAPYINPLLQNGMSLWVDDCARERQVMYRISGDRVTDLRSAKRAADVPGEGWERGILLSPGRMEGQNTLYLFPRFDPEAEHFRWCDEDRLAYEMDYKMRENTLGGTDTKDKKEKQRRKEFWKLPLNGEAKPFFMLGRWEDVAARSGSNNGASLMQKNPVALGKSPYHRIGFLYTPAKGVPNAHREAVDKLTLDYPYALLGFTSNVNEKGENKECAYQSRVFFEDFQTDAVQADTGRFKLPMGSPKPTCFPDYLMDSKSYNDDDFTLRGIKQYWLHDADNDTIKGNKKFSSDFTVLKKKTRFSGRIRFYNLAEDELGLLLWCLRLDDGCFQTVGKGKPYGYGRMSVTIDSVERLLPEGLYGAASLLGKVTDPLEVNYFIEQYVNHLAGALDGGTPVRECSGISEFLYLHSKICTPSKVRYLKLQEYQNRKKPMPTVEEQRHWLEQKKHR